MRKKLTSFYLLVFTLFSINLSYSQRVNRIPGPVQGSLIRQLLFLEPTDQCDNNGITITSTGTSEATYFAPVIPSGCMSMDAFGNIPWTGANTTTGTVTYTFSAPITSATVGYSAVDLNDVGQISINGSSPVQLSNPCRAVILSSNTIGGPNVYPNPYMDVNITVSSASPFTSITLTNIGGQSGWVSGNLCNFTYTLASFDVVVDTKYSYYACASSFGDTIPSFFANLGGSGNSVTIGGMAANGGNVAIIPVVPTPPYPAGMSINIEPIQPMPNWLTFNPDGSIAVDEPNTPTSFEIEFYFILRPIWGGQQSIPIRYNITKTGSCRTASSSNQVVIKPNPSSEFFTIDFDSVKDNVQLELYNSFGKLYYQKQILNAKEYTINGDNLPKGIYILKIIDNESVIIKQLIKE